MLTDEQLWQKCGSGQTITREDIGLSSDNRHDGTQILREGFDIPEDEGTGVVIAMLIVFIVITIGAIIYCF